jgi:hypothetical protein
MCPAIDNPVSCEIRAVIRFLRAKNMNAAEIHPELWPKYNERRICKRMVWNCSKMGEQMFTMKSEVVGRPSVVSDDLVQSVDKSL